MPGDQIITGVIRDGAIVLLRVDVKDDVKVPEEIPIPHIYVSGNNTFISDITEENEIAWIGYSASLRFRGFRYNRARCRMLGGLCTRERFRVQRERVMGEKGDADLVYTLWLMLYRELSDAADPRRFKIPYAFAFELTQEEHDLLQARPDEIFDFIQGKKRVLTWITPEIQWGDELRIRFLRDYMQILRENGHVDWAETVEKLEGRDYLYGNLDLDSNFVGTFLSLQSAFFNREGPVYRGQRIHFRDRANRAWNWSLIWPWNCCYRIE